MQSLAAQQEALKERTRERAPFEWASSQVNLGNTLAALGKRASGPEQLEQAIAAYEAALAVFESAQAPYYTALTKDNLDRARTLLAQRTQQQSTTP
jgi:tetratricopeptide (TPR) repeat protein